MRKNDGMTEGRGRTGTQAAWVLAAWIGIIGVGLAQGGESVLEKGFKTPPDSARPWVYAFWLNGNVTSNGITADLEAMKRVGIGGMLVMDVDQGTPPGPLRFGSPEWRNMFKHLCAEARRLGLKVNMNNDPGWCGSGGPWVTPELSMQKVVWTETHIAGGSHFDGLLPRPEAFQGFYEDIAALAFPTLKDDLVKMADFSPKFSTQQGTVPISPQDLRAGVQPRIPLPMPAPGMPSHLDIEFSKPFTARQMELDMGLGGDQIVHGELQASDDGTSFRTVHEFDAEEFSLHLNFPAVTARWFRLLFSLRNPDLERLTIVRVELSPRERIDHIDAKAMFVRNHSYPGPAEFPGKAIYPALAPSLRIDRSRLLDLSRQLTADGRLTWDAPPGAWTILRVGHTSNGTDNHPAPQGGHGLECDKLSKAGVRTVFEGFMSKLVEDTRDLGPGTLVSTHIDSWETGSQNWTTNFRAEFRRRRGYDLLPFLPTMTGRVVDSLEVSERFLWDLRRTISELLTENYAGGMRELAHQKGIRLSIEAYGDEPGIDLDYARPADEPMAEFWILPPYEMDFSCEAMASAAHVNGKPIVGAEAFTATSAEKWLWHPSMLKRYGDWAFCEGINRFVIHRYAMQPWTEPTRAPGMSMGPFGLHYERTETWWNQSKAWNEYLARCQYLLQQGSFEADVCYLAPETAPQHWKSPLQERERVGYSFDVCSPEILMSQARVSRNRLVLAEGTSYRVLVLPDEPTMTPELLAKIKGLVSAGLTVLGSKPLKSPSLSNYPACDQRVRSLADQLWGKADETSVKEHGFGRGRVIWGKTPGEVLSESHVPPDFEPETPDGKQNLRYIHKRLLRSDVYFVANRSSQPVETVAAFRIDSKRPELWRPDTGRVKELATYDAVGGCTRLPLRLEPSGSVFVLFPDHAKKEPDRITFIQRNGSVMVDLKSATVPDRKATRSTSPEPPLPISEADGTNTFTMAVWAKPEVNIDLPAEADFGKGGFAAARNDALYPPPGHEVYHSPEHAGAGLSIGLNGVCVFEHTAYYFVPILVWPAPLTNWTHVAVVYRQGRPSLYLNGLLVHEGLQSAMIVHSGVGVQHRRRTAPFEGAIGEFFNTHEALSQSALERLMREMPVPAAVPEPAVTLERKSNGVIEAEAWQPGEYLARTAQGKEWRFRIDDLTRSREIRGPWQLRFPHNWGAPEQVTLDHLISWSEHPNEGVKHFSGTATYSKSFDIAVSLLRPDRRVYLDLGKVAVIAEVRLNGRSLGTLWKPPFRLDITQAARPGENELEVAVVNLWPNRMIGDASLPEDSNRKSDGTLNQWPGWLEQGHPSPTGRYTFTTWPLWKADDALRESGLLGPVRLISTGMVTSGRRQTD